MPLIVWNGNGMECNFLHTIKKNPPTDIWIAADLNVKYGLIKVANVPITYHNVFTLDTQ